MSVIYTFPSSTQFGQAPIGITQATDGYLYGVTFAGGKYAEGVLFKMSTSGAITVLNYFNGSGGGYPEAAPFQATNPRKSSATA